MPSSQLPRNVLVVGASLAGLKTCEGLRECGFDGKLTLLGAEPHQPYDRPPLSKELLAGRWDADQVSLRPDGLDELELQHFPGVSAAGLDLAERKVVLEDDRRLSFDALVIATGALPRPLPGLAGKAPSGLHYLRSLDDALCLRSALTSGTPRVVIAGAGFIGLEVASTCRELGLEVTVVEPRPWPMARALDQATGRTAAQLHRDHGVQLRLQRMVSSVEGAGRVESVVLDDGERMAADLLVAGTGCRPATDWLEKSGLALEDGVICDEFCRAAPAVYAAGDVARWQHRGYGESIRLEHWTNAVEQAGYVARTLLEPEPREPFSPLPFFWSDQHGVKIQFVGRAGTGDTVQVVHGDEAEYRFVALQGFRDGPLTGVLTFARPRYSMMYGEWLKQGVSFSEALSRASA